MRISDWSSDVCSSDLMEKMVHLGKLPPQTMSQFYAVTGDEPGASALFDVGAVSNTMPVVDTVGYHEHPAIAAIEIGRASCRERVCQYVSISVVAVSLKKKQTINQYTKQNDVKR